MATGKDLKKLVREYEAKGWVITPTGSGHLKWRGPNGESVFSSSTPSDQFALKKHRGEIKHAERAALEVVA